MNEEAVYIAARDLLILWGWALIGGQPPRGSHDLPLIEIKDPRRSGKGSGGAFKPDLVCYRDGRWLLVEAKPRFSVADCKKLSNILGDAARLVELEIELRQRRLLTTRMPPTQENTRGAVAYAGPPLENSDIGYILADTKRATSWIEKGV